MTGACRLHLSISNARKCSSFGAHGCRIAAIQISNVFCVFTVAPTHASALTNSLAKPAQYTRDRCAAVSSVSRLLMRGTVRWIGGTPCQEHVKQVCSFCRSRSFFLSDSGHVYCQAGIPPRPHSLT